MWSTQRQETDGLTESAKNLVKRKMSGHSLSMVQGAQALNKSITTGSPQVRSTSLSYVLHINPTFKSRRHPELLIISTPMTKFNGILTES